MSRRVVVDTGPLVAIVRHREAEHRRCVECLAGLRTPLLTCWPVLTEAAWLLRQEPGGIRAIADLVSNGVVSIATMDEEDLAQIVAFMERYASIGAQLADAALMVLAEREGIDIIFSLDRRDFSIYRTGTGHSMEIVPEP